MDSCVPQTQNLASWLKLTSIKRANQFFRLKQTKICFHFRKSIHLSKICVTKMLVINQNILEWIFRNLQFRNKPLQQFLSFSTIDFDLMINLVLLYHKSTFKRFPLPWLTYLFPLDITTQLLLLDALFLTVGKQVIFVEGILMMLSFKNYSFDRVVHLFFSW